MSVFIKFKKNCEYCEKQSEQKVYLTVTKSEDKKADENKFLNACSYCGQPLNFDKEINSIID